MTLANPRYKAFVAEMLSSKEAADHGFALLVKHQKSVEFFDDLMDAGLLNSDRNPGPLPAKQEGYFSIPYWGALDYLESIAKQAAEKNDLALSRRIAHVIIHVSQGGNDPRGPQDNYHTWRKFVEIASLLPDAVLSDELIAQAKTWIQGRFDRGSQALGAIGKHLLPRLLSSSDQHVRDFSLRLLEDVSELKWKPRREGDLEDDSPTTVADEYWTEKLLTSHSVEVGHRIGVPAIRLFRKRVSALYARGTRAQYTWLFRPAVEAHPQNHSWNRVDNMMVEALRDATQSALKAGVAGAINELEDMYLRGSVMECRIAIHLFNQEFAKLGVAFSAILNERLIQDDCIHESYRFLVDRFTELPAATQEKIVRLIESINVADLEDALKKRARKQVRWLSAIYDKGYPAAADLYKRLTSEHGVTVPPNPDLYSVHTSWSGPGPSPYSVEEMHLWLEDGSLVDRVNAFASPEGWVDPHTPTKRALVEMLGEAIKRRPLEFLSKGSTLLKLDRPYQYSVINAFSELWNAEQKSKSSLDWDEVWKRILDWIESLLDTEFWAEQPAPEETMTPTKEWIPPLVAEFIKSGTRDDKHAFAKHHLPKALDLIALILHHLPTSTKAPDSEPMQHAVNDARGRVIDALFTIALRFCRVYDADVGNHSEAWAKVAPLFDQEIHSTDGQNFEFTTLAASYWANIHYMSNDWFKSNLKAIVCPSSDASFACAVSGLIYSPANPEIYKILLKYDVFNRAFGLPDTEERTRDRLVERIALAYLWGLETVDTPQMKSLFAPGGERDLVVVSAFLWSVKEQPLTEEQVSLGAAFWRHASSWALKQHPKHKELLGTLARLICYLQKIEVGDVETAVRLAPYANEGSMSYFFAKELKRLAPENPKAVAQAAIAFFKENGPEYDYESLWLDITKLILAGGCKLEAVEIINIMRSQPGFDDLYRSIH